MKNYFTLVLFICFTNLFNAQTLHKQYNLNYCGTGYCNQTTVIHANRYYVAFVEDTTTFPSNKHNLTVMKNDLNGNVLWKRTFQFSGTYTATAAPRKILASGSRIYIGGNVYEPTGNYPFIASIDTTNGNVVYFNKYTSSFSSTDVKINDLTLLNNGDIMAVGRIVSSTSKFFYCLRVVGATGTIVNNGMSTFYSDQEAFGVCQFSNSSIFVVGQRGSYPFIAKLSNTSSLMPASEYNIISGLPISSSFNKIIKSGNNLVVMGNSSGTGQNDFLARIDSLVNTSTVTPYVLNVYTGGSFLPTDMMMKGSQVMVSGTTAGGNSVLFFNSFLGFQNGKAYGSTASMNHSLQFNYPNTYLTTGTWFTGSNLRLYKGDSTAYTSCATSVSPTFSLLTITYTVGQIGVFNNGNIVPVTPAVNNKPIVPITTCLSTNVTDLTQSLDDVKVLTQLNAYTFESPITPIENVMVYDINGKLIYDNRAIHSNQHTFETSQLSSGLYFAKITNGTIQKTIKLIKD